MPNSYPQPANTTRMPIASNHPLLSNWNVLVSTWGQRVAPEAAGWRRAGRPDELECLQPSLRGFDGERHRSAGLLADRTPEPPATGQAVSHATWEHSIAITPPRCSPVASRRTRRS